MRRSLGRFSESEASNLTPSLADFTTTTPELKFSVQRGWRAPQPDVCGRCRALAATAAVAGEPSPAASAGAPSCLVSFEVAAIVGRCLPGDPMKGSAERARGVESHIERNLGDRCAGVCKQGLSALNPPARPVAIRRLPEGLLEGSQKMIWAQPHQIGEH